MGSTQSSSPIRVALRVADGSVPAFLMAAAEGVMRVAGAEVVLIIVVSPARLRSSTVERLTDRLEAVYEQLERIVLRGGPAATVTRQPGPWPTGVAVVRNGDAAAQADAMRTADVDVLIDLAPTPPPGPMRLPGAGRWHLQFAIGVGGARRRDLARWPEPSGLAESLLAIESGTGEVYETGVGVGAFRPIGRVRDRDAVYWRSSLLPARRLARLASGDTVPCADLDAPVAMSPDPAAIQRQRRVRPPFLRLATTVAGKILERVVFRRGWLVMVRERGFDAAPPLALSGFKLVEAPAGRFYADPFVVETPDGPRLYVEDCPDGAHRGRISTLRRSAGGRWVLERVVLDDLAHRAYPHTLRTEAGLVVTPDGGRSGGVDFFLDHGPDVGLKHVGRCLVGTPASDPTLLWQDGRYWLFVTVTEHGMYPWDELHLFSSTSIEGMWHPHPRNPVVADVRGARPAGRIFRIGDALIRPGQDCSESYGGRIVLFEIAKLTPDEYEERPAGSIEPTGWPGIERTHTYSFDGTLEALDGYRRVPRRPGRFRTAR